LYSLKKYDKIVKNSKSVKLDYVRGFHRRKPKSAHSKNTSVSWNIVLAWSMMKCSVIDMLNFQVIGSWPKVPRHIKDKIVRLNTKNNRAIFTIYLRKLKTNDFTPSKISLNTNATKNLKYVRTPVVLSYKIFLRKLLEDKHQPTK
jgi:hypothetical protein